jgi:hypothetical protein
MTDKRRPRPDGASVSCLVNRQASHATWAMAEKRVPGPAPQPSSIASRLPWSCTKSARCTTHSPPLPRSTLRRQSQPQAGRPTTRLTQSAQQPRWLGPRVLVLMGRSVHICDARDKPARRLSHACLSPLLMHRHFQSHTELADLHIQPEAAPRLAGLGSTPYEEPVRHVSSGRGLTGLPVQLSTD